jgi:hypothetical protein
LEVEAGSDVAEDAVCRIAVLEVSDLTFEVFFLVRGTDSGVDDLSLLCVVCVAEELEDVVSEVEALSTGEALAGDSSLV